MNEKTVRRKTRQLWLGRIPVGGGAPVSVQSMTNTDTGDAAATLAQIARLAQAGCDIVRVAVPDAAAARSLAEICDASPLPVIADIHFDYRLALLAIEHRVAGVRLNPGNIGEAEKVRLVAEKAGEAGIPIRVGANSGSLSEAVRRELIEHGVNGEELVAETLVASALRECRQLEQYGFRAIKVSLKASSVPVTVAACRKFADRTDYPLHIGVTEAGTPGRGIIKSAVGIGALLLDGIGDTLRVSLTADPVEEIAPALRILECCNLRRSCPDVISCPTCGRTAIDLIGLVTRVETLLDNWRAAGRQLTLRKLAVMGCVVNGPGEAREAELGIAGGKGKLAIFRSGELLGTYSEETGWNVFQEELSKFCR
ncbi:flavodoxin-dependent (E)-4-hydroxy-3-methylbut-2-enyl-diphosphate synthase [Victivallis sp. Marseille-Q1083]|uniref:flavodoxin-dependent (E)-4-hydroxy-3-methylbut-2-enyl-diphosphate synthase n=1 Tax=Victivallis sp. Marseille-Q1083 TaxID=2717288 RepID=UPI00158A44F5|nr:flavodoxin-dependent (E)-4-hydroxy-3-methylbut-2-enyl-diphosphate synthase [Victivallis sp. Marseille-Q1083]